MQQTLTLSQARKFLLLKHGLWGAPVFKGKPGALRYIRQTGGIQFDPIDVCGRNADLCLQSRVHGYTPAILEELLYTDRTLIDYFDKNLCILPMENWPYYARTREEYRHGSRSREQVEEAAENALEQIRQRGPLSAKELNLDGRVDWYWSATTLSRAVLETLYFRGDLIVHHKTGTNKSYALSCDYLPASLLAAPDPLPDEFAHLKWRVRTRIGAVGLLWCKPSDAFLCLSLPTATRNAVFAALEQDNDILPVTVEGLDQPLYALTEDAPLLEKARLAGTSARMEFLAPLDCMLWDRKLIQALFGFAYSWEIYSPAEKRKYGYYVLPILRGERLIGRIEPVCDRKASVLRIRNLWLEPGVRRTPALERELHKTAERFAHMSGMDSVCWEAPDFSEP